MSTSRGFVEREADLPPGLRVILATHNSARVPEFGGSLWVRLQWLLGLRDLGVDVLWLEQLDAADARRDVHSPEYMVRRFSDSLTEMGARDRWAILYSSGDQCFGKSPEEVARWIADADVLINIGGYLPDGSPLLEIQRRAYVDVDPGFTQIWSHEVDVWFDKHTHHFTVGQNVGSDEFRIAVGDECWRPILPPVHLESWPTMIDERCRRYSTIADWRGSQDAIYEGEYYGTKRSEFVRYLHVPLRASRRVELALCIGQQDFEDLGLLLDHDWRVRNAFQYAGSPGAYRDFIRHSRAEFAVAKHGYVKCNSGWFSDRTACYLASGKPAVVQSTGFEHRLPTGEGLLTFTSVDEAVEAVEEVESRYHDHCRAARDFAERRLDSSVVIPPMLREILS